MTKEEKLARERERLAAMYTFERASAGGAAFVFGIDEAGRGPLCGPVAAACCLLPVNEEILYLNDSKKLSEKKREQIYEEVTAKAAAYGIGMSPPERIDEINILNATLEAMRDAFDACMEMYREKLLGNADAAGGSGASAGSIMDLTDLIPNESDSIVLVDGNRTVPGIYFRQLTVVGGDAKCPSISAASILAKVTRDRLLAEYDRQYPAYGFARHKGYGTKEHIEAIRKYGALSIHRKSFLKNILA